MKVNSNKAKKLKMKIIVKKKANIGAHGFYIQGTGSLMFFPQVLNRRGVTDDVKNLEWGSQIFGFF